MSLKLEVDYGMLNVASGYALHPESEQEEKKWIRCYRVWKNAVTKVDYTTDMWVKETEM